MAATRKQKIAASSSAAGANITCTLSGVANPSLVCGSVSVDGADAGPLVLFDDLAVSATQIAQQDNSGHNQWCSDFYFKNYGGGNRTFTGAWSGNHTTTTSRSFRGIAVAEVQGAATTAPLDQSSTKANVAASTTPTTNSVTTTTDGQYIYCTYVGSATCAASGSFVDVLANDANTGLAVEDWGQTTHGAVNGQWASSSSAYSALIATFKAAAGAPIDDDQPFVPNPTRDDRIVTVWR